MPIKHAFNDFECKYCHEHHKLELIALGCEMSHEIVYVPINIEDLQRLIQFIYTKDDALLTDSLVRTLRKYTTRMNGGQG